jgi:hypothetical protein
MPTSTTPPTVAAPSSLTIPAKTISGLVLTALIVATNNFNAAKLAADPKWVSLTPEEYYDHVVTENVHDGLAQQEFMRQRRSGKARKSQIDSLLNISATQVPVVLAVVTAENVATAS